MAIARLVVLQGPDQDTTFPIPMRGGGIGRGEDNLIQLSDPSVSRRHCSVEYQDGRLTLVDAGSRNKTLVNGEPITRHRLETGDELSIGKTVMRFEMDLQKLQNLRQANPSRVTMEVGSGDLLSAASLGPQSDYLKALADFGDRSQEAQDRSALAQAACQVVTRAFKADRAFLLVRDAGRMVPIAASVHRDDPDGQQIHVGQDIIEKVTGHGKALAIEGIPGQGGQRAALAAPLFGAGRQSIYGLLYADKRQGSWQELDLTALACTAHLVSASITSMGARESLAAENRELTQALGRPRLVGESPSALALKAFIDKVGPSDATVLVTGPSGSGKEMVAQGIHQASQRKGRPFVAVNCAALTETLIESELFGHEKGAFTGATERKIGRFEAANNGTLFLDEVGELPLNCQTKFLRVLEEQCFERVGGTAPIHVNVRVVAATNRDLLAMAREGSFREDLYYRLSVIHTQVPSLAERRDDIPLLANFFLERLRSRVARQVEGFDDATMACLQGYDWPGNIRELRNAVERAIVLGDGPLLRVGDLPPDLLASQGALPASALPTQPPADLAAAASPPASAPAPAAPKPLKQLEKEGIIAALEATGGNKAQAAALLEIDRSTLYKKIKDYGL